MLDTLVSGSPEAPLTLVLAHGAGVSMSSPFMEAMAHGLADKGWRVVRFNFPYMTRQLESGRKSPTDRAETLVKTYRAVVDQLKNEQALVIGGKSMGGRIASLLADELFLNGRIRACLCLGYPFHPIGRPQNHRVDHLRSLKVPLLVVQGERDAMGNMDDVSTYCLSKSVHLHWIADGDHSFKPRKSSGRTELSNWGEAVEVSNCFLRGFT